MPRCGFMFSEVPTCLVRLRVSSGASEEVTLVIVAYESGLCTVWVRTSVAVYRITLWASLLNPPNDVLTREKVFGMFT